MEHPRILKLPTVRQLTGLSTSSIWRYEQNGKFPGRRKIGDRAIGWLESEIIEWINNLSK